MHMNEKDQRAEIPSGTLYMLVLKTLSREPLHGYDIARQIKQTSEGILRIGEGSLYPALQRMLLKGWVTAEWVQAGSGRRVRVYRLTGPGRRQLESEISGFNRALQAIVRVIQPA